MNITEFTDEQRQALVDLLILGMYADRHLASAEDRRIRQLIGSFEFSSEHARQQFTDAAFTRASKHTGSSDAARAYVGDLSRGFGEEAARRRAYEALNELLADDGQVTAAEKEFLLMVKDVFRIEG